MEDRETLEHLFQPNMLILHLAAESHVPRSFAAPALFDRVNREGTRILLEAALAAKARRLIHFSTDEVMAARFPWPTKRFPSPPPTPMSARRRRPNVTLKRQERAGSLSPFCAPASRQHSEKLVPRFIALVQARKPFPLDREGRQKRTFLAVSDPPTRPG